MIFIGYDRIYNKQYMNCIKTINGNISATPKLERTGSTAFTFSRFLIPEHTRFQGWHFFSDSDFLFKDDVNKLFNEVNDKYAVMVVKHPKYDVKTSKMDNKENSYYDRKNWASLIMWNSSHPSNKVLTKDYILNAPALDLLQFKWLKDEEIGELDPKWNVLVDHQDETDAKGLHFTNGINNEKYTDYFNKLCTK